MSEYKFRLISIIALFLAVMAFRAEASDSITLTAMASDSEMRQALEVIKEVSDLNEGESIQSTRVYHPEVDPMTQGQVTPLSQGEK